MLATGAFLLTTLLAAPEAAMPTTEDPFIWLEQVEGEKALEWVRAQNDRTTGELEADSRFETLQDEALKILTSDERIPYGSLSGHWVYNFWQDDEHVRGIWRRTKIKSYKSDHPEWELLLDVDALAKAEEESWVFKGASCLPPERDRCLVTLSRGGQDAAEVREFSVPDKKFVKGGFFLPEAKSDVAWVDRDTLLVSTDWGEGTLTESGYPRVVKLLKRGQKLEDASTVYEGKHSDVGVWAWVPMHADGTHVFVIRAVTFFESELYHRKSDGDLVKLPVPAKSSPRGVLDGTLVLSVEEDWGYQGHTYSQGSLVGFDLDTQKAEPIFVPGPQMAVGGVSLTRSSIVVQYLDNVVGKLRRYRRKRGHWTFDTIDAPDNGVVSLASANGFRDDFLVNFENPVTPDSLLHVNRRDKVKTWKQLPAFYDAEGVVVQQKLATSKDGTKVPYFVVAKKKTLDSGAAPTLLYGYGGFQISILPRYSAAMGKLWIERGGVYVTASIRGGGEFGPAWHQAALKHHRQRAYDDFHAVAESLISTGVTTSDQLGIQGGSNGGLLMGVAFTERPDLYKAVLCMVPLLDMLRYDKLPPGASWVAEYGDPDIEADREALEKFSPYQNLTKGVDYPKVFFITSTKDDRVHPGHARKMAAKMQSFGQPFYYFENIEGGHGAATNQKQRARQLALEITYLLRMLRDEGAGSSTSGAH